MAIEHHPTGPILMAYSAGTLPEAFGLIVATHVSLCDECRAAVGSYDALGGEVLDRAVGEPISQNALGHVMDHLDDPDADLDQTDASPADTVFPAPLRHYVGGDLGSVNWRSVGGGVRQAILIRNGRSTARLLRIPAGEAVPDHGHHGLEMTLVLQGAFMDDEARFGRGDLELADEDVTHLPTAEAGQDCICLAATDAPLKFSGLLPRLAQPFLRI